MDVVELIQTQLALERIRLNREGLLVRIPGPRPDDIARVYVYRHQDGYALYLRHDLPVPIRERIQVLGPEVAFCDGEAVKSLLAKDGPCKNVFQGQTYLFPDTPGSDQFPDAVRLTEHQWPLVEAYHPGMNVTDWTTYAVIRDGRIVSACTSAREDERAGEAYVYTVPAYRGKGYGRQVTAAWAHHLRGLGKIAFFSHAWENPVSRAVALSLGLRPCFALVNYS
jgi:GNAT superfamily N-acetyltransferase